MTDLFLQLHDVDTQLSRPVIEAVPLQRSLTGGDALMQIFGRLGGAEAEMLGVARGQMLKPEEVVEMKVEQGAVHVQQDRVDLLPVNHGAIMPLKLFC